MDYALELLYTEGGARLVHYRARSGGRRQILSVFCPIYAYNVTHQKDGVKFSIFDQYFDTK